MSADNAILLLELKDQWRVIEAFAIDNLYWSYSETSHSGELSPARVFEYFKKAKKFENKLDALEFATKLFDKAGYVEYGIVPLEIKKTWGQILKNARDELNSEKMFVLNNADLKNRVDILDEINYSYSDVLTEISREKYAKQ
jgi:hypothetical protein